MIRTLDRMVVARFATLVTVFLISVPIVWVVGDLGDRQDWFIDREVEAGRIALGYLFMYPQYMQLSFPIAALIAAVFTVHSMTEHREILAAKAGGVSFHRLVAPLWPAGALLTIAAFLLGAALPTTNRRAAEVWGEREIRREVRYDFVYQSERNETLSVQHLNAASLEMRDALLERVDDDGSLHHIWADRASFADSAGWTFHDGYRRRIDPAGEESSVEFDRFRVEGLTARPEELLEDPAEVDEMGYRELGRAAEAVLRSGGNPLELLVEREMKLAVPAATLIIVFFGAALGTTSKKGGASFGVGASLASTLLYILLLDLSAAIGSAGGMPPVPAAWAPNALFLLVGAAVMARVRT